MLDKNVIIWDLDNTLYRITPEFSHKLDETMARVIIEKLGLDLDFKTALEKVKEGFAKYRDGGELFYRDHHVSIEDFYRAYHEHVPYEDIVPYEGLYDILKNLPVEQYIFTYSSRSLAEKILKKLGLFEIFNGRFYSVEDFGHYKKNESSDVYYDLCKKIKHLPKDCIFVDDSYSNLEFAKEAGMTTVRLFYNTNSSKDKTYIDHAYNGIFAFLEDYMLKNNIKKEQAS
ncbi:MAG: HAD-IA family hydrolase [Lactobacillaceae bacterium]|jgi:pyrimidine 5'-nucleotidase|nr:HAD-IA family hydrolase [Lactobacillaceae bacterium]